MSDHRLTLTRAGDGILEVRRYFEDESWGMTYDDEELQGLAFAARSLVRGETTKVKSVLSRDYIAWPGALDGALTEALKNVKHCGDYGTLWINHEKRRVHLTMGDSDGDEEAGLTGFDEIRHLVTQAIQPAWPGWSAVDKATDAQFMEIADEWDPEGEDWREVGPIGVEAP